MNVTFHLREDETGKLATCPDCIGICILITTEGQIRKMYCPLKCGKNSCRYALKPRSTLGQITDAWKNALGIERKNPNEPRANSTTILQD